MPVIEITSDAQFKEIVGPSYHHQARDPQGLTLTATPLVGLLDC